MMAGHDHHAHAPRDPDPVVHVSCVRHSYEDGTEVHLCGLDFVVRRGTRVAVLGPNGSGKTTLLYHVLGLLQSQEGEVRVFGVDPSREWTDIRQRIGVVLQNVDEQLLAPTVADDVAFSPRQYGLPDQEVGRRVDEALNLLGISHLRDRVPHNLSGGEKRKVALAGALVMEPELLVLDEPFEGLDPASRAGLIELVDRLAAERGVTVVISTHDIDSVPEMADYAYVLALGGAIVFSGTPAEVFAETELLAQGNIKPPILAELFTALARAEPDAPAPALSIDEAVESLVRWRRGPQVTSGRPV
jgi:cobalt/nickel transport system ATP-binding protein